MKITIEMPMVAECSVAECAYNVEKKCHARAITIGNDADPGCDTYMGSAGHTGLPTQAGVGACKVRGCHFNKDLECMADNIKVGFHGSMVQCLTYRPHS